ncbi:DEAD/DEAH box helicase family protein [Salegentibacter sp. BDJ18]|uniref:helicase-related protein n=1 Tax=Salegentibacter sp. BDJ18 TaxID=2816376 RepID=UPI001AAFE705|nr:helicase-related protein [Salegentibacter sp. BDJ18]MBO2546008.1 DEAD/DEAH box helicase family protein [Salegentibacter sp. BDJ18]
MKIISNKDIRLIDEIEGLISAQSNIYLSCNYFTSFAIYELLNSFSKAQKIKVLLDKFPKDDEFSFLQQDNENQLNFQLNRKYKIHQVLGLIEDKFEMRRGNVGNQNILLIENGSEITCFTLTPLNLDTISLGITPTEESMFINSFEDTSHQFYNLFQNAWEHSLQVLNKTIEGKIEKGIKNFSGASIYKYCIREIFHYSTINERADQQLQKVGFKDTKIWDLLYNFQKDAVIGAIEKIETYGGCIIADSVGLGKTFEALAVMKYYLLRNSRILVLAPKKLRENWTIYQMINDRRNILAEDRFKYDVLNHTDLSRETGKSGDIDLEMIHWGNYDLVVIDESHNFRNNPTRKGLTRYQRLMRDVIKANIRTKVLMLSATPVNNKMNDLKNQIAFITEGDDEAFSGYGIDSVSQVMKDTQRKFTQWYRDGDVDHPDVNELMLQLDGSYFRILDMLTIARSRKHIEKYYDTAEIGKFPERLTPITVHPEIDTKNQFQDIEQIYDEISRLTLASYTPLGYVRTEKRPFYEERYDMTTHTGSIFKQVDREQSLIYLMRVNLLKRLESSIHSFKITLEKLIDLVDRNLDQLENHSNSDLDLDFNITDIDPDDTELEDLLVGGKTKVLIQDIDPIRWEQDLKLDREILLNLMGSIELIDANRDAKLLELKERINHKIENPTNAGNKKIIIFTAFADTANYLFKNLKEWIHQEKGLYSALVTGSGQNTTNMPGCRKDLNSILTNFSPVSKKRQNIFPDEKNEIDILFCTDCISEGQNLQDCDYLINYDIHWNPVRIIQRFGRIDRIGSKNEKIQLVNFFPSMELDSFIDLVGRIKGRMVMLDVSATGEDNIISKDSREMQDLEYRRRQLKQLQNQVIDLEDVQGNISITDLTFNDFKIDLEKSTEKELKELDNIPPSSYAIVQSNLEEIKPGVIFCLKDIKNDYRENLKNNILYPYFLVYISMDGEDLLTANETKKALDYFRKLCMGNNKILPDLIAEFDKETRSNKKMDTYTALLKKAVEEVVGVQEEIGLDSLANPEGTLMVKEGLEKEDNLELIGYLIIK